MDNRLKQIHVNLDDGKWYVISETNESSLTGIRFDITTASNIWNVSHQHGTTKVFIQVLDDTNSEVIPKTITIVDGDSIIIEFDTPTTGKLNLIFDKGDLP